MKNNNSTKTLEAIISTPETTPVTTTENVLKKLSTNNSKNNNQINILLLAFDLIFLPVHLFRAIIIYFFGSKYNLKGFQFLDVIMHADQPYFNQDDCTVINTIGKDYRVIIRDSSRLYPLPRLPDPLFDSAQRCSQNDDNMFVEQYSMDNKNKIIVGHVISSSERTYPTSIMPEKHISSSITRNKKNSIWDMSTEEYEQNLEVNTHTTEDLNVNLDVNVKSNPILLTRSNKFLLNNENKSITKSILRKNDSKIKHNNISTDQSTDQSTNDNNDDDLLSNESQHNSFDDDSSNEESLSDKNKKTSDIINSLRDELHSVFDEDEDDEDEDEYSD
jgi:hypothetical protein